jgi:GH18 family chitinase
MLFRSMKSSRPMLPGILPLVLGLALPLAFASGPAAGVKPMARTLAVPAGSASTPYPLFGAGPLDFERTGGKVVGVYTPNWESPALVDALPGNAVTHVLYAFLHMCGAGQLPADAPKCEGKGESELATSAVDQTFNDAFARLKARAPHVRVIASVGGWGGSDPFFHIADDGARRAVFAASVAAFLRTHPAFDGVDIDWEHPTTNGSANGVALGKPEDGQGYADLMLALRAALDKLTAETGRHYLVTSAINTSHSIVDKVNFRQAAPALDYVFMMTYDFYGGWTPTAGNHSTLQPSAPDREDGLAAATKALMAAGVPAGKLVAGVAMYGRGFKGVAPPAKGAPLTGATHAGTWPAPEGSAGYREIAARYLDRAGHGRHGYDAIFDPVTQAWNLYDARDRLFMGYDDPRAVLLKGEFVRREGLAGVFAWELSQDNGDILNAMNFGVGNVVLRP